METIKVYIENMFVKLPKTADVLKMKEELLANMEDKYNELKSTGTSEHEAIGIVISEFGNIDELAQAMGIELTPQSEDEPYLDLETAAAYEKDTILANRKVSFGVLLCIISPIPLFLTQITSTPDDGKLLFLGLAALFIIIAVAVAIFIVSGSKTEKYEWIQKKSFRVDESTKAIYQQKWQKYLPKYNGFLIGSITTFILSPLFLILAAFLSDEMNNDIKIYVLAGEIVFSGDSMCIIGLCVLLIMVALGVFVLINTGSTREVCLSILQAEEFAVENKNDNTMSILGGIYWPIAAAIYLVWSLLTNDWHITWVVWPVAGIIFGAISAICNTANKKHN